jgi:hypothetical protein
MQKQFGLGVQRQRLITKGTGAFPKKDRCPLPHYGFLVVECFCQNGNPLKSVYDLRSRLIGPNAVPAPVLKQRREKKQGQNPQLFLCKPGGEHVAVKERHMETWFANAMLTQFLVESEVQFRISHDV